MTTCRTPESRSAVTMARAVSMESMRSILTVLQQRPVCLAESSSPPCLPFGRELELFDAGRIWYRCWAGCERTIDGDRGPGGFGLKECGGVESACMVEPGQGRCQGNSAGEPHG